MRDLSIRQGRPRVAPRWTASSLPLHDQSDSGSFYSSETPVPGRVWVASTNPHDLERLTPTQAYTRRIVGLAKTVLGSLFPSAQDEAAPSVEVTQEAPSLSADRSYHFMSEEPDTTPSTRPAAPAMPELPESSFRRPNPAEMSMLDAQHTSNQSISLQPASAVEAPHITINHFYCTPSSGTAWGYYPPVSDVLGPQRPRRHTAETFTSRISSLSRSAQRQLTGGRKRDRTSTDATVSSLSAPRIVLTEKKLPLPEQSLSPPVTAPLTKAPFSLSSAAPVSGTVGIKPAALGSAGTAATSFFKAGPPAVMPDDSGFAPGANSDDDEPAKKAKTDDAAPAKTFTFGGGAPLKPAFGAPASAAAPTNPFSFGGATSTAAETKPAPTSSATGNGFFKAGPPAVMPDDSGFAPGANSDDDEPAKKAKTDDAAPAKTFTFGGGAPLKPAFGAPASAAAPTNPFSFGGATSTAAETKPAPTSSATGNGFFKAGPPAVMPDDSGFAPGANSDDDEPAKKAKTDDAAPAKTFTFGGGASLKPAFGAPASTAAPTNPFSFGGAPAAPAETKPAFGSPSPSTQSNPFAIGGSTTLVAETKPASVAPSNSFFKAGPPAVMPDDSGFAPGANSDDDEPAKKTKTDDAAPAKTFTFGGSAPLKPAFGAPASTAAPTNPFSFGGASAAPAETKPAFGSSTSATAEKSFSFGADASASAEAKPTFGSASTNVGFGAPAFGGASTASSGSGGVFGFGGSSSPASAFGSFGK